LQLLFGVRIHLMESKKTYCFIDASNLFYGGEKSLGWKVDYLKLFKYLKSKYEAKSIKYFGGVETDNFKYNYVKEESVNLEQLKTHFTNKLNEITATDEINQLNIYLQRVKFYIKLKEFGFELMLKPVKSYTDEEGKTTKKANCDVDMAFHLMKDFNNYDRAIVLTGDGDFLPVLKYLKLENKYIFILARGKRTAKEIKQFAGPDFRDFTTLKKQLELKRPN
jgi:uncharacterized LabA/DUF88 family protein